MTLRTSLGANQEADGVRFRVWAPRATSVEVVLDGGATVAMEKSADGFFSALIQEAGTGTLYRYRVDGQGPFPDPASRYQPQGVHGPSAVVDPYSFEWTDSEWTGVGIDDLILYEIHLGTFTPEGTFAAAKEKLGELRDLGVSAVEIMPVADFPGERNWGYDGVSLFAPSRSYGTPDDFRALVNEAHRIGLAVHLDVVYNHLGPDGAYHGVYSPHYYSASHSSPWGAGLNFDDPESTAVRDFFIENAYRWIHEYHLDGLRLDATHAIVDESGRHFLAELSGRLREAVRGQRRKLLLIAEDSRNLAKMVRPEADDGWGMDGVWADDFHHQMRRLLAGDHDGYYQDFDGTAQGVAETLRRGWFYVGQVAPHFGGPRGTDPSGVPPVRFILCLQNHDQVGNRALGERLHHQIEPAAYRAASALLLMSPQTPLLFMGQEWAASTPFQFFTDHNPELGRLVTEGRRNEFRHFEAFSDPAKREEIPDPQNRETYERSKLQWEECKREPHASMRRLYRTLLRLRRSEPALKARSRERSRFTAGDDATVLMRRSSPGFPALLVIVRLRGEGRVSIARHEAAELDGALRWRPVLSTEDEPFAPDPVPIEFDSTTGEVTFHRPGALILRGEHIGAGDLVRVPSSTYRLQFHSGFGFRDARTLIPYLASLGVTEVYSSPVLRARRGSTHGYDIVDHSRLNPELGSDEDFQAFVTSLREYGLGLILDFVPNHMSVDATENPWWRDVLENGPSARHARAFDIDWEPVKAELKNKLLLPVLGSQYGEALEDGQLVLHCDNGAFSLRYYSQDLPLNPKQMVRLLRHRIEDLELDMARDEPALIEFQSILFQLDALPVYTETDPQRVADRWREKEVARQRLGQLLDQSERIRRHIEENISLFNGKAGIPESFDLLHDLLEAQPYRLSYWRTAMHEINYRRFFDINELAGIRMEDPVVFEETHTLVRRLASEGAITGLRLDHVDGLFDPAGYLQQVQEVCRGDHPGFYVVVEKILSENEPVQRNWAICGSTGYEFLNDLNGLFVDGRHGQAFRKLYAAFTGSDARFEEVVYQSKKLIIATSMASELNVLAHELNRISEHNRRCRDFTLDSLGEALREVVATFPIYRTYVSAKGWSEFDAATIDLAVRRAKRRNPAMESTIFDFIRSVLLPAQTNELPSAEYVRRLQFAMKFQQYTGPVQAKGLEDTAFYRYSPLLSLNEVGGEPARFGRPPAAFHWFNKQRLASWPLSMLTTATHDTKRGEDARARINVLSEIPEVWRQKLSSWSKANEDIHTTVHGESAPDRSDEYLFYQALLGAWPAQSKRRPDSVFVERMRQYMLKAIKEEKVHTSWINPDVEYDKAVGDFVERALSGPASKRFLRLFRPFQGYVARLGMVNSLAQLVLKIASPGVPDFYQGCEMWDLSLVDPDNRRPVDFEIRRSRLEAMNPWLESGEGPGPEAVREMLASWQDGRIKLWVTAVGLRLRRRYPNLFLGGEYLPLQASGQRRDHLVAFARRDGARWLIAAVPRLVAAIGGKQGDPPLGETVWGDTTVALPESIAPAPGRNQLTGEVIHTADRKLRVAELFQSCPAALLLGEANDAREIKRDEASR